MMKIGIAGAGTIVPLFLLSQTKIDEIEVAAISGMKVDQEKMEDLAKQYNISTIYYDYEEMLKDPSLDVIYVAVPNSLHFSFAKKALNSGKNVICEKPFCSCEEEAEELAGLAKEKGSYLFEAITNQYFPNYFKIKELLPDLGDVKIVEMNYSQYSRRYDAFKQGEILPVFDPKKSGGALMDLNVYNIHFVVGLFGKPQKIRYTANIERDIDTSGILVMEYPTFKVVSIGAKDCKAPVCINIQGDKGYIHSDKPANQFKDFLFSTNGGEAVEWELNKVREPLYYELRNFVDVMLSKDDDAHNRQLEHSLAVQHILDEARRQVGVEIQSSK